MERRVCARMLRPCSCGKSVSGQREGDVGHSRAAAAAMTVCLPVPAAPPVPAPRFFEQQPLDKLPGGKEGDRQLLYLFVEDAVKKR